MPKRIDIGQPDGVTVLAPPKGTDLETYKDSVMKLVRQGVPYFNASQIVREQLLGTRNSDGAKLLLYPRKPLTFSPMRGAERPDNEHTPEKIHRRINRLVSKRKGPLDPDGKVIHDSRIQRAAAEHGDDFWALAEKIKADQPSVSKILARHLAAQELGVPALDAA